MPQNGTNKLCGSWSITTMNLTITTYNCRGAISNGLYIQELLQQTDILCIQEHLLHEDNSHFLMSLDAKYRATTRCASYVNEQHVTIRKGGVSIMWKSDISCTITKMDEFGDERVIVIKITPEKSQPMYVINAYLPSSNYSYEEFYSSVAGLIEIYECLRQCGQVIIAGDLNTCINMGTRRHISTGHDTRRIDTVTNFVCNTDQYSVVTDIMCGGPVGTFCPHNTSVMTQIDHIIMDKSMYTLVSEAYV